MYFYARVSSTKKKKKQTVIRRRGFGIGWRVATYSPCMFANKRAFGSIRFTFTVNGRNKPAYRRKVAFGRTVITTPRRGTNDRYATNTYGSEDKSFFLSKIRNGRRSGATNVRRKTNERKIPSFDDEQIRGRQRTGPEFAKKTRTISSPGFLNALLGRNAFGENVISDAFLKKKKTRETGRLLAKKRETLERAIADNYGRCNYFRVTARTRLVHSCSR